MNRLRPLAEAHRQIWADKRFVLLDIDDTLSTGGTITADAYSALAGLKRARFSVIPVTGRPAGWCDMIARMWPVDAVVGENGAFAFRYDRVQRKMHRSYSISGPQRERNRARLTDLAKLILREVPGCAIASDQAYREADLAIDFAEDVPRLSVSAIDRIVELFTEAGAVAKVSSIHVNGWFGSHDKRTTTLSLLESDFNCTPDRARHDAVFVGDSPNDAPMFEFFEDSVGVANVIEQRAMCPHLPHWVTEGSAGQGFVELAHVLTTAKAAQPA